MPQWEIYLGRGSPITSLMYTKTKSKTTNSQDSGLDIASGGTINKHGCWQWNNTYDMDMWTRYFVTTASDNTLYMSRLSNNLSHVTNATVARGAGSSVCRREINDTFTVARDTGDKSSVIKQSR